MNKLIADSGSTKTDWRLITDSEVFGFSSKGINPHLLSDSDIISILKTEVIPNIKGTIDEMYFYGAGISDDTIQYRVQEIFSELMNPSKLVIESDLIGAAVALFGNTTGIVGILGTGSNSGYYNGTELESKVESGGFILGDEGSGSAMGKRLLVDFLRNIMPESLKVELEDAGLTKQKIIANIYSQQQPNKYLASFSEFIHKHRNTDYCQELIKLTLSGFITNHLLTYKKHGSIGIVGSIAFHYETELRSLMNEVGLSLSKVEKSPIQGLEKYHN